MIHLGTINGEDAFTMPLLTGGTLTQALGRPVAEVVGLMVPVARAVAYCTPEGWCIAT